MNTIAHFLNHPLFAGPDPTDPYSRHRRFTLYNGGVDLPGTIGGWIAFVVIAALYFGLLALSMVGLVAAFAGLFFGPAFTVATVCSVAICLALILPLAILVLGHLDTPKLAGLVFVLGLLMIAVPVGIALVILLAPGTAWAGFLTCAVLVVSLLILYLTAALTFFGQ
jgi:hypothetical protein